MRKVRPTIPSLISTLKDCTRTRDIQKGRRFHAELVETGDELNLLVANTLITMYTKCGSHSEAQNIFDKLSTSKTIASWNALMFGYAEAGQPEQTLNFFSSMQHQGYVPDARSFVAALKACSVLASQEKGEVISGKVVKINSLSRGMEVHSEAVKNGCDFEMFVASTLIDMYGKCGSLVDARKVFERMPFHSVVSWNALMVGCSENGQEEIALRIFEFMQPGTCLPDSLSFVTALKACCSLAGKEENRESVLQKGLMIHTRATLSSCVSDSMVGNTLLGMYSRCGSMTYARKVFDCMQRRNVVSWTALMNGYVANGEYDLALDLFSEMPGQGVFPDSKTYVAALKACSRLAVSQERSLVDGRLLKLGAFQKGVEVHNSVSNSDCESNSFVTNTLLDMYAKCGSMVDAQRAFDRMRSRDVVSWTVLIRGYAENGDEKVSLELFMKMQLSGYVPDARTFLAALMACISLAEKEEASKGVKVKAMEQGVLIHSQLLKSGTELDLFLSSALVDLYVKCGNVLEARKVFDRLRFRDVVLRTSLILGYAEAGQEEEALELFLQMKSEGCSPDARAVLAALKACIGLATKEEGKPVTGGNIVKVQSLEKGMAIHSQVSELGAMDSFVANGLLDMYMKCGSLENAKRVFDRISCHDLASWTSMILAYCESGEKERAWQMFETLRATKLQLDNRLFAAALVSCSDAVFLHKDVPAGHVQQMWEPG